MSAKSTNTRNTVKKTNERAGQALTRERNRRHIWSVVMFAAGILLIVFSLVGNSNAENPNLADYIHTFLCGLFGLSTFVIGPAVIYVSIMLSANKGKSSVHVKLIQLTLIILLLSAGAQIIFVGEIEGGFFDSVGLVYELGTNLAGGGVAGILLGFPLLLFGRAVAGIIIVLIAFVTIMLTSNMSLLDFLKIISCPFKKLGAYLKNKRDIYREDGEYIRAEKERLRTEDNIRKLAELTEKENKNETKAKDRAKKFASIESAIESGRRDNLIAQTGEAASKNPKVEEQIKDNKNFHKELNAYINGGETAEKAVRPIFDSLPDVNNGEKTADDANASPVSENSDNINNTGVSENWEDLENSKKDTIPLSELSFKKSNSPNGEYNNAVLIAIDDYKKEIDEENAEKTANEEKLSQSFEITEQEEQKQEAAEELDMTVLKEQYALPPIILLNEVVNEKKSEDIEAEIKANSTTLVETLKSFGVQTKIVGACRGPSVTRYEIQPAPGVMISKITRLVDDIALNLATAGVRIEAPIPNKAAVGIEVPNKKVDTVHFRSLVDSDVFANTESKLGAVIGTDISGEIILADIAKMPHILIAGTTGSGKSVCVNSIIMSILFRSTPDEVRLLMIDPKAVEFMIYNGIPHLLIPVVTDPKKAAGALSWAVTEMLNRYKLFADNNVRDINGYNSLTKGNTELTPMPQIVIFIDELADLMMASPGEVEDSICRLAQMARAAGMHLVIATQRPSVNVVTGVIKANIPSRIALKVASQVDSRTIIDSAGAEKLLGKGDMLYFPVGAPKPMRVQGCWVSDKEVERVVDFIKNSFTLDYDVKVIEEIDRQAELVSIGKKADKQKAESGDIDVSDDKLDEAIEAVIEAGQASTSYLQRRLKLGYGRAARLIDIMEEMGIVGTFEGSKPRQVIMTKQEWLEMKMNQK